MELLCGVQALIFVFLLCSTSNLILLVISSVGVSLKHRLQPPAAQPRTPLPPASAWYRHISASPWLHPLRSTTPAHTPLRAHPSVASTCSTKPPCYSTPNLPLSTTIKSFKPSPGLVCPLLGPIKKNNSSQIEWIAEQNCLDLFMTCSVK